jgi:hypothetical protein
MKVLCEPQLGERAKVETIEGVGDESITLGHAIPRRSWWGERGGE